MRKSFVTFILIICLWPIQIWATTSKVYNYCLSVPFDDAKPKMDPFGMNVQVKQQNNKFLVSFSNYMPDSGQSLIVDDSKAVKGKDGKLRFKFIDNWENTGKGWVAFNDEILTINIDVVKKTTDMWGINAGRQYGKFTLKASDCPK